MIAIPHLDDYPPPFRYALADHAGMVRRALWAIESGLGGEVEWVASFGTRQASVELTATVGAYGTDFGKRKAKHKAR